MLQLSRIKSLEKHHKYLSKKMNSDQLFLVGGCIRDLLLGITKNPLDIDYTMAGNPLEIYEKIDKEGLSHFITEKFGTITLIPKDKNPELKYELTPLRTETGYGDFRHPEEIQRSDDLVADAKRRDFTINALYFTMAKIKAPQFEKSIHINEEKLLKILAQEGFIFLADSSTLIVHKESYIQQLFPHAKLDQDFLYYLLDIQHNAYTYDKENYPQKKQIWLQILIDPTGGLKSLHERKIVTVGEADKRFNEDALRILRAMRLVTVINHKLLKEGQKKGAHESAQLTFDFESETRKSIKKNHDLLKNIAKERIKDELVKSFSQGNSFNLIALLDEAGLIPLIFPALELTRKVDQPIRYHPFDIYAHILLTLFHIQSLNENYLVRFAMLYHDVGKVGQYAQYGPNLTKEEIRAIMSGPLNHRFSSAVLAKEDFRKLGFSNKEIEEIQRYIREHHTPWEILLAHPNNRKKKLRKLLSEAGFERVNNVLDINIADRMGMYNPLQWGNDFKDSYYLKTLLKEIQEEEGQFTMKDLAISGKEIIEHFELKPWSLVWELLHIALDRVLGDIKSRNKPDQIFANLTNYLKHKK